MTASPERIREVVERYVELVGSGTAAEIVELYADGATVEDPVGSDVLRTREEIATFYGNIEGLEKEARLGTARICGNEAVFVFELVTKAGDQRYTLSPIDHMVFDDDAKITAMRAFWGADDMVVS